MPSPVTALDYLTVSVASLGAEVGNYRMLLDREPAWEGTIAANPAALFATDNVKLLLLESATPRGLEGACFRVDELDRMRRRLQRVGVAVVDEPAMPYSIPGTAPATGSQLTAQDPHFRGLSLAFSKTGEAVPAQHAPAPGAASALDHMVIASSDAQATAFVLAAQLGLDMRMDMSRPEWDARLMFFRCGELIVEVFQQLSGDGNATEDSFYGLSWRVTDADAARARLAGLGFDVSEVRTGRRPGTRVLTVRDRTAGVATLLIEAPQR